MGQYKVTIFGAGNVGMALASLLAGHQDFAVRLADCSDEALDHSRRLGLNVERLRCASHDDFIAALAGQDAAVAAVPENVVAKIASAAAKTGVHYLDFSKTRPDTAKALKAMDGRRVALAGCGASPGLIDNCVSELVRDFSSVDDLVIRVGAIPRFPTNRLGYGLIWNIDGLFDEYTLPSIVIRDGQLVSLPSLDGYERFTLDGIAYECFMTSGGVDEISGLPMARPKNATFKTIRHPGHLEYMRFLLDDLGLRKRRDMLKSLLNNGLPLMKEDVVIFFVSARGYENGRLSEKSTVLRFTVSQRGEASRHFSALNMLSAGHAATLLDMLRKGEIDTISGNDCRTIPVRTFLASPFLKALCMDPAGRPY